MLLFQDCEGHHYDNLVRLNPLSTLHSFFYFPIIEQVALCLWSRWFVEVIIRGELLWEI